ncbi:MAG: type II toxin-antitoxin system RelE/ParE family toxin [Oscillospiraceae bacterium]|jgi:plasmid stabilization system protein ParE|nr:type II toxin-antitoxin system RelE/ParE family toxin [Oscillospiraceae bacterium]
MDSKYQVNISAHAAEDLRNIYNYISSIFLADKTAANIISDIRDMIYSLEIMPQRFSYSLNPMLENQGYRRALVKKYVILYLIDEGSKVVNIARIFHGSMDYGRYI